MKFGVFYEHQIPRPWEPGAEAKLFQDTLDQVELADRLGFDYYWQVEHHFLEEYSHSSAPEVFLGALSQRTKRIRLGHGIVHMPPPFNHPARVAERIATLDLVSGGRAEFGTGEASSEMELGGFNIDRADKRAMWEEGTRVAVRCLAEEPFTGHEGKYLSMPARNVVPKPVQKPHPPLWVACSRRDTIHLAAQRGIGALSFSFIDPDEARLWVDDYYDTLASDCDPIGEAINPNLAIVTGFMCCEDEGEAIAKGLDGFHFFGYSLAHYYVFGNHTPGTTDIWSEFQQNRERLGFSKQVVSASGERLGARIASEGLSSLRGAIGTPDQIRDYLRGFEEAGVDQVIFVGQGGRNRHEDICASYELFAREVMPEFAERDKEHQARKAERVAPIIERANALIASRPVEQREVAAVRSAPGGQVY